MSIIQGTSKAAGGAGYQIDQSIRFNDDDSASLNRTPGSAGNRRTFTFSCWVKRANLTGANQPIFSAGGDDWLMFLSAETLGFNTSGSNYRIVTSQLFRDTGAWMHVCLRVDTTNATAGDRLRLYINGSEVTSFGTDTNPTLNLDTAFNNTGEHRIGKLVGAGQYFDGYLAEIHHVDGTSLGPGSFGETNDDGVWIPKAYDGSYGTNGFFIDGRDSSDLGDDESGNGNDFASSGLAAADQMSDSPTNNFCVLNPLDPATTGTLSDGNLVTSGNSKVTIRPSSGQWYYEKDGVGVSYNADTSGIFNPTLAAGTYNFGQSAFSDTGPTGSEKVISTANLATPSISDGSKYFQTTLYTGTGSSRSVDQSGNSKFQPDWVWVKARNAGYDHALYDAVRGVQKELKSNDSGAEATITTGLTAFESDGFQVGSRVGMNGSSDTFVAWQWLANGSGSSNEDGSINTTATSANTTAGFSISTYTGTGSNATVGHGLGAVPKMIIVKERSDSRSWVVYHEGIGDAAKVIYLNQTAAAGTDAAVWNSTAPTSTVFSVGTANGSNGSSNTYIAYCFAEIPGYSSIGSYTGNGSADGPMIYTSGMKPAWIIIKRAAGGTGNWDTFDIKRDPINPADAVLDADSNGAEASYSTIDIDFLSNGVKVRGTQSNINTSGSTYIYMAFGNPYGGDGVAPATAR
jgi:hypothetical protein